MTRAQAKERDEAIAQLREWIKPGDTVYTICDHVSSSGMSRHIRVLVPQARPAGSSIHNPTEFKTEVSFIHPNWAVGRAIGARHAKRNGRETDALLIGGCGMDMGFHVVYELSHALYGAGYACLGKGLCPSNYHANHRDSVRCEGTRVHNPDGPDFGQYCYAPSSWHNDPVPADWPRGEDIDVGEGQSIHGRLLYCVEREDGQRIVCSRCHGAGSLPNPEGPERFDLTHTDGYALRHRWL